jgi:maleate isomerase
MTTNDNWGWRARIGIFIVASEAVPEAEWWAMAPKGVSIHAARVVSSSPWAKWRDDRSGVELGEDMARGCKQFSTMPLSAAVLAHTTSSVVGGKGWDRATAEAMSAALGGKTIATTNGTDTMAALRASGVRRPFLVLPPWFPDDTIKTAVKFYADHDFAPIAHMRYDAGRKWRDLPPGDLYSHGIQTAQEIEPLYAQIRAACPPNADGVLIGGTGFRCVGIIEQLERDLQRPVITANQASLWHCLRLAGLNAPVEGYGSLLRS